MLWWFCFFPQSLLNGNLGLGSISNNPELTRHTHAYGQVQTLVQLKQNSSKPSNVRLSLLLALGVYVCSYHTP